MTTRRYMSLDIKYSEKIIELNVQVKWRNIYE